MLGQLQEASQKELAKRLEDKVQRHSGATNKNETCCD
jgi:hypothetical protein